MNISVFFSTAFGLLRKTGQLTVCAASLALVCAQPAQADQIERHDNLASRYINEMHADPLVADCAAHGSFIASMGKAFDRVDFSATSFDSAHSSVSPWNAPFDQTGKQRTPVDTVATVEGVGVAHDGSQTNLRFRCGYVDNQMLAFSWNNPVAPVARSRASSASRDSSVSHDNSFRSRGHGRHRHLARHQAHESSRHGHVAGSKAKSSGKAKQAKLSGKVKSSGKAKLPGKVKPSGKVKSPGKVKPSGKTHGVAAKKKKARR